MFSLDDVNLQQRRGNRPHPDATVIHKGVHDVHNWFEWLQAYMPEELYWNEIKARTSMLIETTKRNFPDAVLFWRDIYYHHADDNIEEMNVRMRQLTNPLFQQHGFVVLPGFNVSSTVPERHRSQDGLHQSSAVKETILSMIACTLCPSSPKFARIT